MAGKLVPELESGCVIPQVENLMDEKFCALNEVSHVKLLGTIVHRFGCTIANIQGIFIISIS
jgi:hypothetical protein